MFFTFSFAVFLVWLQVKTHKNKQNWNWIRVKLARSEESVYIIKRVESWVDISTNNLPKIGVVYMLSCMFAFIRKFRQKLNIPNVVLFSARLYHAREIFSTTKTNKFHHFMMFLIPFNSYTLMFCVTGCKLWQNDESKKKGEKWAAATREIFF